MNTHKRQGSTGSNGFKQTNNDTNHLEESFYSLDYFMNVTKQMEDEIMVPSKLKDKLFGNYCYNIHKIEEKKSTTYKPINLSQFKKSIRASYQ